MTQWYIRFISKNEKLIDLIKALKNANLLQYIELSDEYGKKRKRIDFEDLPKISKIDHIDLGWCIYSFVYGPGIKGVDPNTRCTTISVIGADQGLDEERFEIIKIAGETLEPYEVEVICEEEGPKPVYKGEWNFEIFRKKILPKIEFDKK